MSVTIPFPAVRGPARRPGQGTGRRSWRPGTGTTSMRGVPSEQRQRIAAYGVVLDAEDRLLLARAAPWLTLKGRWFLPGGGVATRRGPGRLPAPRGRGGVRAEGDVGPLLDVLSDVRTLPDGVSLHTIRLDLPGGVVGRARCGPRPTGPPTP